MLDSRYVSNPATIKGTEISVIITVRKAVTENLNHEVLRCSRPGGKSDNLYIFILFLSFLVIKNYKLVKNNLLT